MKITKGIIFQVEVAGDAAPIVLDLPSLDANARVAWVFEGHASPISLIQGADGPGITVPVDGDFPVSVGPLPLSGGPDRVLIAESDTEVTITLVRL